jgi:hypothetical protein
LNNNQTAIMDDATTKLAEWRLGDWQQKQATGGKSGKKASSSAGILLSTPVYCAEFRPESHNISG